MIVATLSSVAVPEVAMSSPKTLPLDLDSIDWSEPKNVGLNAERMADGINDSIRERSWLVTGFGAPELFSDSFVFSSEEGRVRIKGYEQYCRWVHDRYKGASCDLICCSVTAPNTITAVWRFVGKLARNAEVSKVIQSTFITQEEDGLVVSEMEKVLVNRNAPSAESLRYRCNWSSCALEGIS